MLGLLRLPNFSQPLVTQFAFANITHLLVKILQLLSLRVGRHLDGAFLRHDRDFEECVLVRSAIAY